MFTVAIEQEIITDKYDPLIIKENIDDIIQSIEEQLYNINPTYRNIVRKIKNNIKKLSGINESDSVLFEHEYIDDKNVISYISNVLELALDCTIATLSIDEYYKHELKNINSVKELLQIDHENITILKEIFENNKELINVYQEVNEDVTVNSKLFYEILDSSICNAIAKNKDVEVVKEEQLEDRIYNNLSKDLQSVIGNTLEETYNNIKYYSSYQIINENWFLNALVSIIKFPLKLVRSIISSVPDPIGRVITISVVGIGYAIGTKLAYSKISNLWQSIGRPSTLPPDIVLLLDSKNLSVNIAGINKLIEYTNSIKNKNVLEYIYLSKFINENVLQTQFPNMGLINSNGTIGNGTETVLKITYPQDIKSIIDKTNLTTEDLDKLIVYVNSNNGDPTKQSAVNIVSGKLASSGLFQKFYKENSVTEIVNQRAKLAEDFKIQLSDLKEQQIRLQDRAKIAFDNEEALEFWKNFYTGVQNNIGHALEFGASIGSLYIGYRLVEYLLDKGIGIGTLAEIIRSIKIRNKINALRKEMIIMFPFSTLKTNFENLDSEIKKEELVATRSNDPLLVYQSNIHYMVGSYSIILFACLESLKKDSINVMQFRTLSDVYSFDGFATLKTKTQLVKLKEIHDLIIDQDLQFINSFELLFKMMKNELNKNSNFNDFVKQLPKNISRGLD